MALFLLAVATVSLGSATLIGLRWAWQGSLPAEPWQTPVRGLGFPEVGDRRVVGVWDQAVASLRWDGPTLTVALTGPRPDPARIERAIAALVALPMPALGGWEVAIWHDTREAVVAALGRLSAPADADADPDAAVDAVQALEVALRARRKDVPAQLHAAAVVIGWTAAELAWTTGGRLAAFDRLATDPDVRIRRYAVAALLAEPPGSDRDRWAARAAEDVDPAISVAGALLAGEDGLPVLVAAIRDPATPGRLAARALAGAADRLAPVALVDALGRTELAAVAAAALGRVGTAAELPAMRAYRGPARREVARAIDAIVARVDGGSGALSLADGANAGRLSEAGSDRRSDRPSPEGGRDA